MSAYRETCMELDAVRYPKIMFVLTVDTEEEWDWSAGYSTTGYSVTNIQKIPRFQAFCDELGVRPTYFIDYAILSEQSNITCFRELAEKGTCELGAHLHPWVTPPLEERITAENTHAVNLPPDLVKRKLAHLTGKLEHTLGIRPVSFRSGRWGMNATFLNMLLEQGYTTDSSVFPFYTDASFSYAHMPDTPYWPDLNDLQRAGSQRRIFEIPVTSGFNRPDFSLLQRIHQRLSQKPWTIFHSIGILWHLKLLRKLQLSPELTNASNMIALINACVQRGHRLIHMFLHSSSLLQGGSPYVSTGKDEERFYQTMADVLNYLKANADVRFCTVTEAGNHYSQEEKA